MSSTQDIFNISIVGLSVANVTAIRQLCREIIPSRFEVHWVNVVDPELDFLIIDADFVHARSIQQILSYRPIPVLKVVRYPSVEQSVCEDTLFLPINDSNILQDWIVSHLLDTNGDKQTNFSAEMPSAQPEEKASAPDLHLFERLNGKTLGLVKLIDAKGVLGVADTTQELFWPSPQRLSDRVVDHTLGIVHSTNKELQEMHTQARDLKQWIWDVVWHSPSYMGLLTPDDCIQLLGWPQPQADEDRREVLQMAAVWQQQLGTIRQVATQTQIALPRVQLFASALVASGLAQKVSAQITANPISTASTAAPSNDKGKLKGFLSKLRQQFGL
ncbi:MAG: hypothetical protein VXW65_14355 [Pseudomonadota bacterium]|nr:hypothetical protein [Pseudomonadota bacterium]